MAVSGREYPLGHLGKEKFAKGSGDEDDQDFGHVAGDQVIDELADIGVDHPTLLHGRDNADVVIVGQHHIGGFLGHIRAGDAHRDANIGALDGGCIVDPVAGHGDHLAVGLQGIHDAHLVLRRNTGKDIGLLPPRFSSASSSISSNCVPESTWCPGRSSPMDSATARAVLG